MLAKLLMDLMGGDGRCGGEKGTKNRLGSNLHQLSCPLLEIPKHFAFSMPLVPSPGLFLSWVYTTVQQNWEKIGGSEHSLASLPACHGDRNVRKAVWVVLCEHSWCPLSLSAEICSQIRAPDLPSLSLTWVGEVRNPEKSENISYKTSENNLLFFSFKWSSVLLPCLDWSSLTNCFKTDS